MYKNNIHILHTKHIQADDLQVYILANSLRQEQEDELFMHKQFSQYIHTIYRLAGRGSLAGRDRHTGRQAQESKQTQALKRLEPEVKLLTHSNCLGRLFCVGIT